MARLNLDGVADATFGPAHDGKVRTPLFGPTTFRVADAVRLADGKILTVGRFDDIERRPFHVTRFNADGSIDKTFGFRGTLLVDLPGGVNVGPNESALVALPGGNFAVGVISNPLIGEPGSSRLVLMQFDAQGRVDTTFADEGVATIDLGVLPLLFGESDSRLPLVRDSAGRFVVAVRRPSGYVLTRLSANGRLDTSFGADGFAAVSPGPAAGTGGSTVWVG